jgi:hypothetical protein
MNNKSILDLDLLKMIIAKPDLHARWLNTLSYLENCGARMIASCEHPTHVRQEMLKHAAEEFRHAYLLKKQLGKITSQHLANYSLPFLMGGVSAKFYLKRLNDTICRRMKQAHRLNGPELNNLAYLLVTFAIETRASSLYPIYQQALTESSSKVSMRAIIAEEEEHLHEISEALQQHPEGLTLINDALSIENDLFESFTKKITNELLS